MSRGIVRASDRVAIFHEAEFEASDGTVHSELDPEEPGAPSGGMQAAVKTAVPADPSAQWGADAERMLTHQRYPGITVRENPGDEPTHGTMVSLPGQEETLPSLPSAPQVRDYVHRHHDVINDDPENYYGGWEGDAGGPPPLVQRCLAPLPRSLGCRPGRGVRSPGGRL